MIANAYSVGKPFRRANGVKVAKGRFLGLARFTDAASAHRCAAMWLALSEGAKRPGLKYLGTVEVEA